MFDYDDPKEVPIYSLPRLNLWGFSLFAAVYERDRNGRPMTFTYRDEGNQQGRIIECGEWDLVYYRDPYLDAEP